jgi:fluoride exporter
LLIGIAVALAGGVGAATRCVVDFLLSKPDRQNLPWGTMIINVSGSALLGLLAGASLDGRVGTTALLVLGSGFLGGYTTFSTASHQSMELFAEGRTLAALFNSLGMLVAALAAAAVGVAVGVSL